MLNKLPQPWRTVILVAIIVLGAYVLYTSVMGLVGMKQVGPIP
jgi:hypothetical protein